MGVSEELITLAERFCRTLEQLDLSELRTLSGAGRDRCVRALKAVSQHADEMTRLLGGVCEFCRKTGGEPVGVCEQCGRPACTECAAEVDGHVLHTGTCTLFFEG